MLDVISIERENFNDAKADLAKFDRRKEVMADFLDFDILRSTVVNHGSVASLIAQTKEEHKASSSLIYRCWSLLCRYGFTKRSGHIFLQISLAIKSRAMYYSFMGAANGNQPPAASARHLD